jgi:hypothetical protein
MLSGDSLNSAEQRHAGFDAKKKGDDIQMTS